MDKRSFQNLNNFLLKAPSIIEPIRAVGDDDGWWVKFSIDIEHVLAWHVVQELSHVLNYLSLSNRLPTVFKPVSPPPYINGGPRDYLSWVIECDVLSFKPGTVAEWLESRLPKPVEEKEQWINDEGA